MVKHSGKPQTTDSDQSSSVGSSPRKVNRAEAAEIVMLCQAADDGENVARVLASWTADTRVKIIVGEFDDGGDGTHTAWMVLDPVFGQRVVAAARELVANRLQELDVDPT
jgi:hypothetical protein